MKGHRYSGSGDSVPLNFQGKSHENLAVTSTASTSQPIPSRIVLLSLVVGAHVKVSNGDSATVTDMVMPAGVWPLLINRDQTISLIKLTGSDDGQASVIIPEEK